MKQAGFFMAEHNVSLLVAGVDYYGWLTVTISSDLEKIARDFEVSLTRNVYKGQGASKTLPIKLGNPVVVKIDGKSVLTGYISSISISHTATDLSISIKGVSKTGVLNDCTAPDGSSKAWKQQTAGKILSELAGLYDIEVIDDVKNTDKKDLTLEVDKTIGSAIKDIQKNSSLIVTDDEEGRLIVINKKNIPESGGVISVGDNVLSAARTSDLSSRFSKYVAIGQGKNPSGEKANTNRPKATAEDKDVKLTRVKVFKVNGSVSEAELKRRAELTRDYLSAGGEAIEYSVPGWYASDGELWKIGTIVNVVDELSTGSDAASSYLIKSVSFTLDGNGTQTKITVKPVEAYTGTDYSSSSQAVEKAAKDKAAQAKKTGGKDAKSSAKQTGKNNWVLKSGSGQIK